MQLYEIVVPQISAKPNNPSNYRQAHAEFRAWLNGRYGGYTMINGWGSWVDSNGRAIDEAVYIYRVATNEYASYSLATKATDLFRDEQAIFVAYIGKAAIINVK